MPVFINEVVIRGDLRAETAAGGSGGAAPAPDDPVRRAALIAEVTQAVIDHLERELDRLGER